MTPLNTMSKFYHSWRHTDSEKEFIIEDDGKVAYAYLLESKKIVGDVWLYNQAPTPHIPEWTDRSKIPFLNPSSYCQQPGTFEPVTSVEEVAVEWLDDNGQCLGVVVYIRDTLAARVMVGERPGASVFALRQGPLAKPLIGGRPS